MGLIEGGIASLFDELTSALFDPRKRVFWGFLLSACFIALGWLILIKSQSPTQALRQVFERSSWLSRSAISDYKLMLLNSAIMRLLSPQLLSQLGVSIVVFQYMHEWFGGRPYLLITCPEWLIVFSFTFCLFLIDDCSKYIVHRLLHQIPALWSFHKVHHTATSLNPFTVYRTHPLEGVVFILRAAVAQGTCIACFVFFLGDRVSLATILGASIFSFTFNALGANLRHSHINLGFWKPIERILISPAQHQIHHSTAERHLDKNFGAVFAIWDWVFGTHCYSKSDEVLEFGVPGERGHQAHTLSALYLLPFREVLSGLLQGKLKQRQDSRSRKPITPRIRDSKLESSPSSLGYY